MKLASLKDGTRDGQLIVVSRDLQTAAIADTVAPTLQRALDDWTFHAPQLRELYDALNHGRARRAFAFEAADCMAPLPRAFQWADASAYLNHVELVRRARGAELPPELATDPLMYQGGSDDFLGPRDDIVCASEAWGIDFEAEVAVVTGDVPMGTAPDDALKAVRLVMLANDVSLRNLIPAELAKGFGFFQSKPATAFSPLAVTTDELGESWRGGRLARPMLVHWNGKRVGQPDAGTDMTFHFGQLIAHAAKTRNLRAGTIVGSGTVSNRDATLGYCCIAEKRCLETIEHGAPATEFMRYGDRVRIEMLDAAGKSIFGAIEQAVAPLEAAS
ncbi:fumarylacetoacetate hydrolase family protein [Burkholderia glumae]|uniref:fumarylacetoacetate hydrolase family protein n=1 Tax=Burkholderia glumae TaxID=337 RepID=UPI002149A2B7|nr:fumarylacetoacetate hydrolase family protein [Burkholderia glumae]MCR1767637.1 fumarylacetoacetate hydrolase family protein [Burkholderia glumae]